MALEFLSSLYKASGYYRSLSPSPTSQTAQRSFLISAKIPNFRVAEAHRGFSVLVQVSSLQWLGASLGSLVPWLWCVILVLFPSLWMDLPLAPLPAPLSLVVSGIKIFSILRPLYFRIYPLSLVNYLPSKCWPLSNLSLHPSPVVSWLHEFIFEAA